MQRIQHESFTTKNELNFIRNLGTHKSPRPSLPIKQLLEGYIHAAERRDNWEAIDKHQAIAFAYSCLYSITKGKLI